LRGVALLFTAGALLVAGQAGAGAPPRESSFKVNQAEEAAAPPVAPTDWTRRLLGRFKVDGVIHHQEVIDFSQFDDAPPDPENSADDGIEVSGAYMYLPETSQSVEGKVDCVDFSDGPGLQCVLNVVWPETWRVTGKAQLGGASDLTPAMVLAGFMPATAPEGIKILLVDKRGLGHPGALVLKGNTASASPPCVNMPGLQGCEQRVTVTAKADGAAVYVNLTTNIRFTRSKLDRKLFLYKVPEPERSGQVRPPGAPRAQSEATPEWRPEKSSEFVTETLDVAFVLKLEPPAAAADEDSK